MNWLPIIVSGLLGGGFLSGVVLLLRLRPEAGQITVSAAQGAVIVQTGVIESLTKENHRLQQRISDLEAVVKSFSEMRNRILALEMESRVLKEEARLLKTENAGLKLENEGLRERLQLLEADVADVKGPMTDESGGLIERRQEEGG